MLMADEMFTTQEECFRHMGTSSELHGNQYPVRQGKGVALVTQPTHVCAPRRHLGYEKKAVSAPDVPHV
jgi:hypothetical protein